MQRAWEPLVLWKLEEEMLREGNVSQVIEKKKRQKGERLNMKMHLMDFSVNESQQQRPKWCTVSEAARPWQVGFPGFILT